VNISPADIGPIQKLFSERQLYRSESSGRCCNQRKLGSFCQIVFTFKSCAFNLCSRWPTAMTKARNKVVSITIVVIPEQCRGIGGAARPLVKDFPALT
jgi:hypothetical protein